MRPRLQQNEAGLTLPELMITTVLVGVFFAGIFEMSAVCFRYISAGKENIAAIECVHDRLEQMRNLDFPNLTDANFHALPPAKPSPSPLPSPPQRRNLTTPANASELAQHATEVVTISTFNGTTKTDPSVKFTRPPGAKISPIAFNDTDIQPAVVWSGGNSLAGATAVQIDVSYTWLSTLGRRARTESSSTIVSGGTKK